MRAVPLPRIGTDRAWRDAARGLLAARVPPEDVLWEHGEAAPSLFEGDAPPPPPATGDIKVPKAFVGMAGKVVWHRDPQRFARLYALLWRLRRERRLMEDRGDADLAYLRQMEKHVMRCRHKMTAFVRFREIGDRTAPRRSFAAWFEPTHRTMELTAPFFVRRFGDMDWLIATPDVSARFEGGTLTLHDDLPRPDLPEDANEELWRTYFCNIFNPARVKIHAMTSEMPKKYWKNLPEAQAIPGLLADAEARVREMAEAAPTLPPLFAERIAARASASPERPAAPRVAAPMSWDDLKTRADEESRDQREGYGRVVLGEGPPDADLMIVGEQPGDIEDQEGRPFVGPAGQLFDRIAQDAGIERRRAYVTNAVKRFKFQMRGKRRMHQTPNGGDIEHARWWIEKELELVQPKLILGMGGTAAETLTGTRAGILKRRGTVEETRYGPVFLTVHPSYILRLPDADAKAAEEERYRRDLAAAQAVLEEMRAA
ncbi:UdgX family uracil-DNA binding protein [Wenxinia marina]|uniref:Type-4 uracil-DNA glycosylase n=1 Tax=Wenxinia marina DSM 24838 TaxID=1123501 RepID=A0A0D0QGD2_9RHOB|nr:UdgX family uracil-DNA binding protein [Wenxinia marina]KIQ71327.1 putative DNA metabolism protein [Wenxinia marina DSM 24838]GGL73935.1 uracil-DNA glycosylase [Wenxinia marina]